MANGEVGILLAGGLGTRLGAVSQIYNKHLALVYDRPMIDFPLQTLKAIGCHTVIIVSTIEGTADLITLYGNNRPLGMRVVYRIQTNPGGIAQALGLCRGLVSGTFPVILGDNYFQTPPHSVIVPSLFLSHVDKPNQYGIYDPISHTITEKPEQPVSNWAVTGLYYYDENVFRYIDDLNYSPRGEMEITDVNNAYLRDGGVSVNYLSGDWEDMGTPDGVMSVAMKQAGYIH